LHCPISARLPVAQARMLPLLAPLSWLQLPLERRLQLQLQLQLLLLALTGQQLLVALLACRGACVRCNVHSSWLRSRAGASMRCAAAGIASLCSRQTHEQSNVVMHVVPGCWMQMCCHRRAASLLRCRPGSCFLTVQLQLRVWQNRVADAVAAGCNAQQLHEVAALPHATVSLQASVHTYAQLAAGC
jgi:hypothetical protein